MKRVAIIGTVGVPGRYGGFETLAHQLVNNLSDKFKLKVYCSSKAYKKEERTKHFMGARLYYLPFNANGVQSIIYDFISIIHALFVADTLIILGVSGGLIIPFVRLFTNKKIIVNIDGLEWRRAKWNKPAKAFLKFSERVAVKFSHADITDNAAIKRYTSVNYNTLSHLIEYGGDHVIKVKPTKTDYINYPFLHQPYAFKVARIEPENNIHMVIEAFAKLDKVFVIVGNWDKSDYGINLRIKYAGHGNLFLLDAIYDQRELDLLRSNSLVYVHGHSAGGTNPSLVEAMYLNLPVIAFDCSYNKATTEKQALYFKDAKQLNKILETITVQNLVELGDVMGKIAIKRYTWKVISNKYSNLIYAFDYKLKKHPISSRTSNLSQKTLLKKHIAHLKNSTFYYEEI